MSAETKAFQPTPELTDLLVKSVRSTERLLAANAEFAKPLSSHSRVYLVETSSMVSSNQFNWLKVLLLSSHLIS